MTDILVKAYSPAVDIRVETPTTISVSFDGIQYLATCQSECFEPKDVSFDDLPELLNFVDHAGMTPFDIGRMLLNLHVPHIMPSQDPEECPF